MAAKPLLTQNSHMRAQGIFNWTLPAWAVRLPDGRTINVCPQAGVCAKFCYALENAYRYPSVRAAHLRNLLMVLETPLVWKERMAAELRRPRYQGRHIRIHDAGDFFSDAYLVMWLDIMRGAPEGITFYAYTKEVSRFRRLVEPNPPRNFKWVYSLGGREDQLIDLDHDRHADVFPDQEALEHSEYASQEASDTLAVHGPPRVGMAANRRRVGLREHSFGQLQRIRDAQRAARRGHQAARAARSTAT
ncbi:GP88 family protein [Streptomyces sp. 7N604]|uniref:GP88 family protein n=1 Tax=Streptomyces sp. 7N604 TaxID=3457415 RepID=UPI003FCF9185